jgi:small-conductance mechanosensitive channel
MNGGLAWLLFIALYCFAVQRWARDLRRFVEPWLRRREAWVPLLSVLVTAFVVFAPVGGLYLAAHYRLIPWHRAGMLLGITLMVSCVAWLLPGAEQHRTP